MIEGPELEHGIHRSVWELQAPGIAQPRDDFRPFATRRFVCLLDVERNRVDQRDPVPARGQPTRVITWAAANVENIGRWRGQEAGQQFLRA